MAETKEIFVVSQNVDNDSQEFIVHQSRPESGYEEEIHTETVVTEPSQDFHGYSIVTQNVKAEGQTNTDIDNHEYEVEEDMTNQTVIQEAQVTPITLTQDVLASHMGHNYSQAQPGTVHVITEGVSVPSEEMLSGDVHQVSSQEEGSAPEGIYVAVASSSMEVKDSPFCLVCSDKGSGYHYSVYSCEGCKGFFKRTVQKNLNYTCKDNQECDINKFTRNNCQYCRFQKCVAVGMKREAVREDRTPGGKHRHKRPRTDESMEDANVYRALQLNSEVSHDDLAQKLVEAAPDMVPQSGDSDPITQNITPQMDINDLMQYGYMELRMIIEWARKVPGFSDLLIEDQMALLKASFMELNVLRLSFRSIECPPNSVRFAENIVLTQDDGASIGWGKDLIFYTLEFISTLKEITIDHTEFCILNAIILTYPDAFGVQDKKSVTQLQNTFLDALRKYSLNTYQNEPRRYPRILLRLPTLRALSAKAAERFLSMSLDGSIKMNSLVLEMMS